MVFKGVFCRLVLYGWMWFGGVEIVEVFDVLYFVWCVLDFLGLCSYKFDFFFLVGKEI